MEILIVPFGMATLTMLFITAFLGFGKWKLHLPWIKPNYHYAAAIVTVSCGIIHMLLNAFNTHHI